MHSPENHSETAATTVGRNQRSSGRFRQAALRSSLGPVLDLSATGMRVRTRRPLEGDVVIELIRFDGTRLALHAKAIWSRKCGWFKYDTGLIFSNLSRGDMDEISRTAMAHRPLPNIGP